ncbi:hypothetical protein EVAR_6771_1 [Eumeta japonica]|uniref:Uncharacterized protein n=1 Tax=Eumeta variegata TaxID=151549 RepID=A0A4C1V3M9_EUMVA|nr:hypothetical protein EVAR_6771_1 [Eumeta japonica]
MSEKRLRKTTELHLDRCLRVETNVESMAAEAKRTQAAAKPRMREAAKPQVSGLMTTAAHTLIVSSRCVNYRVNRWSKPSGMWLTLGRFENIAEKRQINARTVGRPYRSLVPSTKKRLASKMHKLAVPAAMTLHTRHSARSAASEQSEIV